MAGQVNRQQLAVCLAYMQANTHNQETLWMTHECNGASGTSVFLNEHSGDDFSTASDTFNTSEPVAAKPPLHTPGTGDSISSTAFRMVGCSTTGSTGSTRKVQTGCHTVTLEDGMLLQLNMQNHPVVVSSEYMVACCTQKHRLSHSRCEQATG